MAAIDRSYEVNNLNEFGQYTENPTHKLIIPSFGYQLNHIDSANIAYDLGRDIPKIADEYMGVLMAGLLPFRLMWKFRGIKPGTDEGSVTIVKQYKRSLIPLRFIRPEQRIIAACRLGMEAYETYFESAGRPDIIYAYDLLYAGTIAYALHRTYGIPYVVITRNTFSLHVRRLHLILDVVRNVLLDSSEVCVKGSEPYRQLRDEFGDLEMVRKATVIM